jgi:putative MATE family efflux protein
MASLKAGFSRRQFRLIQTGFPAIAPAASAAQAGLKDIFDSVRSRVGGVLSKLCRAQRSNSDLDLTTGPIWPAIWQLSWPVFFSMLTLSLSTISDGYVAGRMSAAAQAAVGAGEMVWFLAVLLSSAVSSGMIAIFSRFWGQADYKSAIAVGRQSIKLAVAFGLIEVSLGISLAPAILHAIGLDAELYTSTLTYLRFNLFSLFPYTLIAILSCILRASGNTIIPARTMMIVPVLVTIGDYLLCIHPFHLGLAGIGIAWSLASGVGLTFIGNAVRRDPKLSQCLQLNVEFCSRKYIARILRIGIPTCLGTTLLLLGDAALTLILARCTNASASIAAWSVGCKVEFMIVGVLIPALAQAAQVLVGQNLGAGQPKRAEEIAWKSAAAGVLAASTMALPLLLLARPIAELMSVDAGVVADSIRFLYIAAIAAPFRALSAVLYAAMEGAGYVAWPLAISVATDLGARLPAAWLLTITFGLGPLGCWVSIGSSAILSALLFVALFKRGAWQHNQV